MVPRSVTRPGTDCITLDMHNKAVLRGMMGYLCEVLACRLSFRGVCIMVATVEIKKTFDNLSAPRRVASS